MRTEYCLLRLVWGWRPDPVPGAWGEQGRFKPTGVPVGALWLRGAGRGAPKELRHRLPLPSGSGSTGSKPRGRRREEGRRGLPLVRGGLPGPWQPFAPHWLVPERAVLVDAAHSPQAAVPGPRDTKWGHAGNTRLDEAIPGCGSRKGAPAREFLGGT